MATLYITEFSTTAPTGYGNTIVPIASQPSTAEQTVAIGGSSTQSSAFNAATRLVRLHTDAICSVEFGSNPTATVSTSRMAANQTEYYSIPSTASYKVAVISNT